MDEYRHKILVAFYFYNVMYHTIRPVVAKLQWILIEQYWNMMNAMLFFMEFVDMALRVRNMWKHEKVVGYMNQLLESFFEFFKKQETRLSYDTFRSLIRVVGSSFEWKNTHMRENIHVEIRIAMALALLSNGNSLQMCKEVYGIIDIQYQL